MEQTDYCVLGLMSGTSLDGLDLACCVFSLQKGVWKYRIEAAKTVSYTADWKNRLAGAMQLSSMDLLALHRDFGRFMAKEVNAFVQSHALKPNLISSHGHTVFHQPDQGITVQIGDGAILAAETGITTVCDLRSMDVALGGQGAPLVPIGDRLLFAHAQACLNLGGIANVSFEHDGSRVAFDIAPCNIPLNALAKSIGLEYDADGNLARSGAVHQDLLSQLNALDYYAQAHPKSLGMEWVLSTLNPLLDAADIALEDKLRTLVEHVAFQIARSLDQLPNAVDAELLVTGGGAMNAFLVERIRDHVRMHVHVPDVETIQFKEALIFAFLGLLRMRGEVNALASVTGARRDSSGGAVYFGSL